MSCCTLHQGKTSLSSVILSVQVPLVQEKHAYQSRAVASPHTAPTFTKSVPHLPNCPKGRESSWPDLVIPELRFCYTLLFHHLQHIFQGSAIKLLPLTAQSFMRAKGFFIERFCISSIFLVNIYNIWQHFKIHVISFPFYGEAKYAKINLHFKGRRKQVLIQIIKIEKPSLLKSKKNV